MSDLGTVVSKVTRVTTAWIQDLNNLGTRRFVMVPQGATSLTDVQASIDICALLGRGTVVCAAGVNYTGTALPIVKEGVLLDMNGATFTATLGSGNVYGLRLGNYSGVRNGTINVISTGTPSSQFIFHACISVGEGNSLGGTVASPSLYSTVHDFLIHDMVLSSTREHVPVIQMSGNVYNGWVKGITIPSNPYCSGVHLDWSDVGSPVSSSNITGTRAAFDAGLCYTTHPHGILIEDIVAGNLSVPIGGAGDLGSNMVRMSACYNITVRNLQCDSVTLSVYRHVGGDLGFEFAPASVKPYACKGNTLDGVSILAPGASFVDGVWVDTIADNVYREQFLAAAYVPLMDPLMHGSVRITGDLAGPNLVNTNGVRVIQARGVRVSGGSVQKFHRGVWVGELTRDIEVDGVMVSACREDGIRVGENTTLREGTERVTVRGCVAYGNGTAGTGYGINVVRSTNGTFDDNKLGVVGEATQDIGLVVADNGVNFGNNVRRNHVFGATLAAYSIPGTSAPYFFDQIGEWVSNTADLSCPQTIAVSQDQVPIRNLFQFSRWVKEYISNVGGDPTTGHWKDGSLLLLRDAISGQPAFKSCTLSGSFGTLAGLTNASTNSTNVITCSLAATTATTTAGGYSAVVASAANLRVGLLCSIAGAVTDARIINIAGTTIQLDKPTKAVTGAAFTTAGLIEGEVISINTTTPQTGCVVMKITGMTVTLDTAMVDTQTGRTLSYTTPVFKNHAAIA